MANQEQEPIRRGLPLDFKVAMTLMVVVLAAAVVVLALTDSNGETKTIETTVVTKTVADPGVRSDVAKLRGRAERADGQSAKLQAKLKALSARIDTLAASLARVPRKPPQTSGRVPKRLDALTKKLQTANGCLFQLQKQLDDLQAFAISRESLHRRVSGACLKLLKPRYAGK